MQPWCEEGRQSRAPELAGRRRELIRGRLGPEFAVAAEIIEVKVLDFFSRPRGFPQKGETGFNAGIEIEAANVDLAGQSFPAPSGDEGVEHGLEGDAVQRVLGGAASFVHRKSVAAIRRWRVFAAGRAARFRANGRASPQVRPEQELRRRAPLATARRIRTNGHRGLSRGNRSRASASRGRFRPRG